jgi:hypothetical protein
MRVDLAFVALAVNPIGGILIAIPFAILELGYPAPLAVALSVPLAYVQVVVVDLAWSLLEQWSWFRRLLERRRSPRVERLIESRGAFVPTFALTPFVGPWVVMAFMRYARVPQRRIAAPVLLAILTTASVIATLCVLVPESFRR